jgi:hypothetical protein
MLQSVTPRTLQQRCTAQVTCRAEQQWSIFTVCLACTSEAQYLRYSLATLEVFEQRVPGLIIPMPTTEARMPCLLQQLAHEPQQKDKTDTSPATLAALHGHHRLRNLRSGTSCPNMLGTPEQLLAAVSRACTCSVYCAQAMCLMCTLC